MARPHLLISAPQALFTSFFSDRERRRLDGMFVWERVGGSKISAEFRRHLRKAEAIVTTWDSPGFDDNLEMLAPRLRIVSHCGGEVKSRFARPLFERLTITNAPEPMARATAELGAAFLLYCARNVDFYRSELRKPSSRIYDQVHVAGTSESLVGKTVAMIGFGRIGRALVDLMRGFDLKWLAHDPYADPALAPHNPVRFLSLNELLANAHCLVLTAALTEQTRGILGK